MAEVESRSVYHVTLYKMKKLRVEVHWILYIINIPVQFCNSPSIVS